MPHTTAPSNGRHERRLRLGVLDPSPICAGATAAEAVRETLELAELAEQLGYHRYWLTEHHNQPGSASATPEILLSLVAARTRTMRVGSGGVMLSNYSPLKVAETFRLIEALFPGRIDLGIGRGPGCDPHTAKALEHGPGALGLEHFPEQLAMLRAYLGDDLETGHPFHGIRAMPEGPTIPELWLLGRATVSADYAARYGWAFSFAHFMGGENGPAVIRAYREQFQPSAELPAPRASVAVPALCAETEQEARRLAQSLSLWAVKLAQGQVAPVPSVEEAAARRLTAQELAIAERLGERFITGDPEHVKTKLLALAADYDVDELLILTIAPDYASRRRSYALIAQAFGLAGGSSQPSALSSQPATR